MDLLKNKLLSFNSEIVLNKREVGEYLDYFVAYHRQNNRPQKIMM